MGMIFGAGGYSLRHLAREDVPQLFGRFTSNEKMMRYLPIKTHTNVVQTEALALSWYEMRERDPLTFMAILTQDDRPGWIVGVVGVAVHNHGVALSLIVHRDGAGAGRKFCPQLVHWLLAHPPVYRVWAYTDIDNKKVENLLTKMGAKCEGVARRYAVHPNISPEPRDCRMWSIIK